MSTEGAVIDPLLQLNGMWDQLIDQRKIDIKVATGDPRFKLSINSNLERKLHIDVDGKIKTGKIKLSSVDIDSIYDKNITHIQIHLLNEDLSDHFNLACIKIINHCSQYKGQRLYNELEDQIDKFKTLFKPDRRGLKPSEFIGFFGEIYFLSRILIDKLTIETCITSWKGALGELHDFSINNVSVEIKTSKDFSADIKISSKDQLAKNAPAHNLYLASIIFNDSVGDNSISLNEMNRFILQKIDNDLQIKSEYLSKASRFLGAATEDQLNERLELSNLSCYLVDEKFPALTSNNTPAPIRRINYSLDKNMISRFGVQQKDFFEDLKRIEESNSSLDTLKEKIILGDIPPESKFIEYKETASWDVKNQKINKPLVERILKTMVSFFNTNGGFLCIGITDHLEITGIENELDKCFKNSLDEFQRFLADKINTLIGEDIMDSFNIEDNLFIEGKQVFIIECLRSEKPIWFNKKEFIVRDIAKNRSLEGKTMYEYIKTHFI